MSTQPIHQPNRAMSPTNVPGPRAASAAAQNAPNGLMQSVGQVAYQQQQPTILQSSTSSSQLDERAQGGTGATSPPPGVNGARSMSPTTRTADPTKVGAKKGAPPTRPRRDDDANYGVNGAGDPSRSKSPTDSRPPPGPRSGSAGPPQNSPTQGNFGPSSATSRVTSPIAGGNGPLSNIAELDRSSPPGQLNSPQSVSSGSVQQQPRSTIPANLRNTGSYGRSPSPVVGNDLSLNNSGGSTSAPPDAFYNPRSPSLGGVSSTMGGHGRQGSLSGMAGAELMREARAKDAEIESSRRRERWLKLEIGRAMKAGFLVDEVGAEVPKEELEAPSANGEDASSKVHALMEGLMRLKKDKAKMEVSLTISSSNFVPTSLTDFEPASLISSLV